MNIHLYKRVSSRIIHSFLVGFALFLSLTNPVSAKETNFINNDLECLWSVPDDPVIQGVVTNDPSDCGLIDGNIFIIANGDSPLEYSINGGVDWQVSGSFNDLSGGSYMIRVRNQGGGTQVSGGTVVLIDPVEPVIEDVIYANPVSCQTMDGMITISATGAASLEYSIYGGSIWQHSNIFENLNSDSYDIAIRNSDGSCEITGISFDLVEPTWPVIENVDIIHPSDCELTNGIITITASADPSPVTFNSALEYSVDNGMNWQTDYEFEFLSEGSYTVKVRRTGGGCEVEGGNFVLVTPLPPAITQIQKTDPADCGGNTGQLLIFANTGSGSTGILETEFSIDNGENWQTSNVFNDLSSGAYTVLIRNENGSCEISGGTQLLQDPDSPIINEIITSNPDDCNAGNGEITILAEGPGILEYSINGGQDWQHSNTFADLEESNFQIYVRNEGGNCLTDGGFALLFEPEAPEINQISNQPPTDCGLNDGVIQINASGIGEVEYSIDNGENWQLESVFSNLGSGTFQVWVRNITETCIVVGEEQILIEPAAPYINDVISQNPDCGAINGNIIIQAASETGNIEYSIDDGLSWQSSPNFENLSTGEYNIEVRIIGGGCFEEEEPIVLSEKAPPQIVSIDSQNPSDCEISDGFIEITSSGGAAQLEYSIDAGSYWTTESLFQGLDAGIYATMVRNQGTECTNSGEDIQLNAPSVPSIDDIQFTRPNCGSVDDGSIEIFASGGQGVLSYSIDAGSNWQISGLFENLPESDYAIMVKNEDGTCQQWGGVIELLEHIPPEIDIVYPNNPDCGMDNGGISIIAIGGEGILQYSIDGIEWQSSPGFAGVPPGTYQTFVRNEDGSCIAEGQYVLLVAPDPPHIDTLIVSHPTDCGASDGNIEITATVSPGMEMEYSIDGGITWQADNFFDNLPDDEYAVQIQMLAGTCQIDAGMLVLSEPPIPEIGSLQFSHPTDCGFSDGQIEIEGENGTGNYEFTLDGGLSWTGTNSFTDLSEGSYHIKIRNANGSCENEAGVLNLVQPKAHVLESVQIQHPNCNSADGEIDIQLESSFANAEYSIDGGILWQSNSLFTDLQQGTYSIHWRNADTTCVMNAESVQLSEPILPVLDEVNFSRPYCENNDGEIEIVASGGEGTLLYSIDGGINWSHESTFSNLSPGSYFYWIRTENTNCLVEGENYELIEIVAPELDAFQLTDPQGCGINDGQIDLTASGEENIEYSIDNGMSWQTEPLFTNLGGGNYAPALKYTGDNCETYLESVTLNAPSTPSITESIVYNPSGCEAQDGRIQIMAQGGNGTYEYSIDGGTTWQVENMFLGLSVGNYSIVVRNVDGSCSVEGDEILLEEPETPEVTSIKKEDVSDCGLSDGNITIQTETSQEELEFSIDGGINWHAENIFDQLSEGEYSVWIRNTQTSCISEYASNPVFIYAPEPPTLGSVELKKPNHCSTMDGEITILTEETTGLEFSIDNGNVWQIENTFSGLSSGQYDIFIRRIGSDCITAYDGNPLVISCNETIDVTISAEATTVCLENVLPEMVEVNEINDCQMGNSSTVEAVLAEENCVLFTPAEGFSGYTTSPICVLNCHESEIEWCDTIYFTLQVLQPKECDPLFSANILEVEMAGEEVEVCLSVPLLNFINYEKIMDGEPFQEAVSGCQMDTSYFYTYAHLVGGGNEGPYDLTSWQVEHNVFTTTFDSISELVDSMKIWDAEGNWVHDPLTMTIRGGVEGRQYTDMNITHVGSGVSSSLSTNFFVVVNGTNILLSEYGLHEFILNDTIEGCSDTILINVTNPTTPQIDTLDLLTAFETAKMDICPEGVGQLDICDQPQNGSLTADGNCVIYIPSTGFVGMDEFCLILCDDNIPQLCDTTIYFMQVLPPLDTMNISIFANTSSVFCLSEDVLQLPGNISEYSICAVNPDEVTVTLQEDGCGILLPTDGFSGLTEVCVAYCDDSDPVFCDITSLQVTVEGIDCEESIFEQDSLILPALLGNMAYVCIPLSPIEIFLLDYEVVFDGENYEGAYSNCDMDSLFVYTYASLPGLGTVGPYSIDSWEANGNTFSGQAENITAILDSLNSWDPAGNWELDVLTFTIRGGDSHSAYGDLIITQLSSGLTSTLVSNFTNIANGTEFTFIGEGYHSLYIKNNLTGCSDELIIEIQDVSIQPDTLYFQTQQGQAFTACVDTSVLSGNILSLSTPCASPNSAVEAIDLECVNYTPNPEFLGVDVVCVVICDDSLMCDTTVLVVTVEENCPDIIEEEAVVIETTDCESGTDFCLPVSITDISQYQIFVDGEAYSGDVTGCLNDTAIAYTYFLIPDGGSSGPYMLDSWVVNGITYSFPFENLETLVDSMNIWDPGAGWTISTSLQNIMGGNPASQYGMMTITQESSAIEAILEPNLTLTPHGLSINLSEGMRQVVIEETGTACRDTIKVEVQCIEVNCDLFSENEFSIETASCDSLAVFCMEFDMESLLSYNITDNGQPYEKDLFNCNIDSLFRYMYMAIPGEGQNGPYKLQSWRINDQTFSGIFEEVNALVDSMNVWDTAGNWTLEPSTFTISGGWAGNIYGVMEIIQIFTGANAILNPNQIIMPDGIGMEMDTGYHELIFTHTQYSDCSDTLSIQVNCPSATEDIQLDTTFFIGEPITLCLEDYGFPMDGIMSAESVCDDQFNGLISFVLGFDYCVDIVPLNEGQDTFCLELCYESGDCVTFSLHATILPPCDQLFEEKYFGMGIDCESTEEFGICLPVTLPELADYKLSINGDIYTEEIVGCDYDSTLAYSYFAMPSQGTSGPYTVESWTIDGEEVGGVFENVSTLVDSMNIWDPTANWVLNTTSLTITGGNPSIDYGTLNIIQNFTGAQASLEVNSNLLPKGVWIEVVPATYTMMFTQQITGCTDTLIATLACLQTESLMDTVLVGQTDTLCLDTDELNGEIVNVESICEESSGEVVLFSLLAGTTCVEYEGMEPGTEQFCVEICDNLGICDTTYLTVLVEEDPLMANAPVAIPDTARVLLDGTLVLNLLGNDDIPSNILDTFYILTPPQHGTAIFNSDGTLSFIPETGYCNDDQPDTLEYVICNSSGCDTASASITIMCSEPEQEFEIFSGLSPNGDGINDTFVINNIESFPGNKLQIFNRWGTLIFQKEDYDNSWAGKWESDDVPDGTYFYLLKDGKGNTFSGYLHILR